MSTSESDNDSDQGSEEEANNEVITMIAILIIMKLFYHAKKNLSMNIKSSV